MDLSINYPYGIPFYTDLNFIKVFFQNNDTELFTIYFVKDNKIDKLAGIVFPHQRKKYNFPEKSIVAIITQNKPEIIQCHIRLQKDMLYIYP